jgi:hypothetical protein
MSDMGWIGGDQAFDRLCFFRKAEEILKNLHDIEKYLSWDEKKVLEKAGELITQVINQKMNESH